MRERARLGAAVALCWWLVGSVALAEPTTPHASELAATRDAGAEGPSDPTNEARRLYAEGKTEYAQGRLEEAIALFERAYALSEAPGLLFNLAQAHRLAGDDHCPQAYALYKSYLAAAPAADNRLEVEERIAELRVCASRLAEAPPASPAPTPSAAAPEPAAPAPPPAPRDALAPSTTPRAPTATNHRRLRAAIVTGLGVALMIAGGVLYAEAAAKHREAERVCPCYPGTYSTWSALTNVSYAAMGVGGAALVGGVSWWLVGAPAGSAPGAHAALALRGHF
jgi:tetratricopeptide (TPR) repeat protein